MVLELAQIVFKSTVFCLFACALSAGCSKTVVLGSECPGQEGPCGNDTILRLPDPVSGDGSVLGGGAADSDSSVLPAGDARASDDSGFQVVEPGPPPVDAGQPIDVAIGPTSDSSQTIEAGPPDAGTGLLQNPSFELRDNPVFGVVQNQFGLDVLVNNLAGYVPRAGEFFANIDPWFACWVGAQVESDLGGPAGGLQATLGEALITTGYGPAIWLPGLFQILEQPLEAGRSYSFTLDVINSGNARSALWVGGTNLPCAPPEVYAATPELTNRSSWSEYCVTFRPTHELGIFALMPVDVADGGVGQVSFDNVRQVESCPQ